MTISEIKQRTEAKQPYFFSRKTLKFFGQTVSSFKVSKIDDRFYMIYAPRRKDGKSLGMTERIFDSIENDLIHVSRYEEMTKSNQEGN